MKPQSVDQWRSGEGTAGEDFARPLADPNVFYGPALLPAALEAYDPGQTVSLIEARDAGGPFARLPVAASTRHGRFPARHCVNWLYPHAFYGAPLLAEGREAEGWAALLAQLDAARWAGDFLHLRLIDPDATAARALLALCRTERRPIVEIDRHERAMLRSERDAEAYWSASLNAKVRKELRRKQNRLAERGTIERHVLDDPAALGAWCATFLALEQAGWKGEAGTALACTPADAAFFTAICSASMARGELDFLRLDCDGEAIAMLVSFLSDGGGFGFKTAYDPAFAAFSPGVLIQKYNLARVLDDGRADWMDSCAVPGHPMIDHIWTERRAMVQYRVALKRPGLLGARARASRTLIGGAERAAQFLRRSRT